LWLTILIIAAGIPGIASASTQIPAKPQDHPIALVGGTIHPVSGPDIVNGTVVFDKGKIIALGSAVNVPADAEKIDVTGKHVYPGLIDANTAIGLTEIGAVRATNDRSEVGPINPNVKAQVAVNPESELIPVARSNGVTLVLTAPNGGVISGTSALLYLDGWTWEDMTFKAPVGMHVNWPSMVTRTAWWMQEPEEKQLENRDKALNDIRNAFADARAYMTAKQAEATPGVSYHKFDSRWEAMIPVLEGTIPLIVNADQIQQIQAAVAFAEKEKVKLVIQGGYDAPPCADLLKRNSVPVIVDGTHREPERADDPYDNAFTVPERLRQAGITFCISGGGEAANVRNLPYQAATAVTYGLPRDEGLKAITLYPAQILGVADRVGSLETGKDATIIVTTGDPLEIPSQVTMEFIQGKKIDLSDKQKILYEKYKERYRRMGMGN
jgi:imidazolonepropionase-like amidohydrolase